MNLTLPFPDEFALGYAGRLRILNQAKSAQQFGYRLRDHFVAPDGTKPSLADALILASGQTRSDFLRHHSLIGYHLAVTNKARNPCSSYLSRPDLIAAFGFRLIQNEARFCSKCLKEDRQTHGIAYWHRSHQLAGIYWCHLHGDALRFSPGYKQDFWKYPETFADVPPSWLTDEVPDMVQSESLKKYYYILDGILEADHMFSVTLAKQRIRSLLADRGIRTHLIGTDPTLGQVVQEATPKYWFFIEYAWKIPQEFRHCSSSNALDLIFQGSSATKSYAIALAVTHPTSKDALAYWYQAD